MTSPPFLPVGPSASEIDAMKKAMQAISGDLFGAEPTYRQPTQEVPHSSSYAPQYGTSAEDVAQMKGILERLNQIEGTEQVQMINESSQTYSAPASVAKNYGVTSVIVESNGRARELYDVVILDSRQPVVEGIVVKEAAQGVMRYLNKGLSPSSNKVQELLDLDESYNRNRIEAGVLKGRYQRASQLGEMEAADVFKARFNKVKAEATVVSDQIKAITASIR